MSPHAAGPSGPSFEKAPALEGLSIEEPQVSFTQFRGAPLTEGRRRSSLGSQHAGHSNWIVAAGHLVTAVIGAGVLGLPDAVAWLGWIAGPVGLVVFFYITLWASFMLSDVYQVKGIRHTRYKHAVYHIMGPLHSKILSAAQHANMILTAIGYQIAASESMRYVAEDLCGSTARPCLTSSWGLTLIFGGIQLLLSQLPNLESAWWASIIGAVMSIGYSSIALGLGASEASNHAGSLTGRAAAPMTKIFGVFTALGTVAFAYNGTVVLLEIQDTLKEPPKAAVSMKKTILLGSCIAAGFYMAVSVTGYMALGDAVPSSIVLGFSSAPRWATLMANLFVVVHLIPAYQVYSQPVFATFEDILLAWFPRIEAIPDWITRAMYRSLYVGIITVVAVVLPFFDAFVGLIGAVTFFPLAVFYPFSMYRKVYEPKGKRVVLMKVVTVLMAVVALLATVSSVETIAVRASSFKFFSN